MTGWFTTTLPDVLAVILSATGIYAALIVLVRLTGLRSFSKMSSFDFAMTVAMGSLLASALLMKDPPLLLAIVGLASLFGLQYSIALLRRHTSWVPRLVDNQPLLLMIGEDILHENLARARVTEADLRAKLREANVLHPRQVRAVVLETTGDISVLHTGDDTALDPWLLEGVRDKARFARRTDARRAKDG